jgi:hypothetical protein
MKAGARIGLKHCAPNRKAAGSIPDEVIGFFSWPNPSSRSHYGPEVDSVSNKNDYQEFFGE